MNGTPDDRLSQAEANEIVAAAAAAGVHGYAIGEFLCPVCGGTASVCVSRAKTGHPPFRFGGPAWKWWVPWREYVAIELICQGPADPSTPDDDPRWDHAGQVAADLLVTRYLPIGLN